MTVPLTESLPTFVADTPAAAPAACDKACGMRMARRRQEGCADVRCRAFGDAA